MKTALAILTVLVSPCLALAQGSAPPPALKLVSGIEKEKGEVTLLTTVIKFVPVTVEREVIVNGMKMKITVTEYTNVSEQRQEIVKITDGRVITPDGKQLPLDDVWKRLTKNTVIAVSIDGNTPAQTYLRALSPNTLILIPGPPAPMPKKE